MKSIKQDGGECRRKWYRTRRATLLRISGDPPKSLCMDELNLTICCRYVESLLENPRISKYLGKHHPIELGKLRNLLDEFEKACETQQET
jgi:hypothetical protein